MPITGYSANLPGDILMDTGVLYAGTAVLGVTRGAPRFDPGKSWSNIEFDGQRSDILGLHRVDRFDPVIACTLIEFAAADIDRLEPGNTDSGTGTVVYVPKAAGTLLVSADYISDLRLVFERGSSPATYAAIHFAKALVRRWQLAGNKNDIGLIEAEFLAVLDMATAASVNVPPYTIELRDTLPSA